MALKIVKASDPLTVDQIVVCLYGSPGAGKSTLGFSAHKPVLLDFDKGAYRAAIRGDSVQVASWSDVTSITADDLAPYQTVVVDTAGRALDFLSTDIIRRDPKMGRGGALTLQGYGRLKTEFAAWLSSLRTMGKDVVLIAHSSEDKNGDDLIERIDMQGSSKGEVYKVADAMGRLYMVPGRKLPVLNFSPSDTAFGKNPGRLDPLPVPDVAESPTFLGEVIQQIKDRLNALSADQQAAQKAMQVWREALQGCESLDDYNDLIEVAGNQPESIRDNAKKMLVQAAKAAGFTFDRKAKAFTAPEPVEETA